ncbi:MAG: DEAD/DEAH box helicase, partial [Clostridia bacterium]|nr:DEAD/DEAH box helicase [Clostridia bacterium]
MRCLSLAFGRLTETAALASAVRAGRLPAAATGLTHIHKVLLIGALCRDLGRRALVVVSDDGEAAALAQDLASLGLSAVTLPTRDLTLRPVAGLSREYERARVGALARWQKGECDVLLCSVEAARLCTLPPDVLAAHCLALKPGDTLPPMTLAGALLDAGYAQADTVEGPGQFARRGDILDVYPPDGEAPVRLEYWGDEIDSINRFDVLSQRRTEPLDALTLTPAAEVLTGDGTALADKIATLCKRLKKDSPSLASLTEAEDRLRTGRGVAAPDRFLPLLYEPATVLDYAGDCLTLVSETARVAEHSRALDARLREEIAAGLEEGVLCKGLASFYLDGAAFEAALMTRGAVLMDTFARGQRSFEPKTQVAFTLRSLSVWNGSLAQLLEDAKPLLEQKYAVAVLAGTEKAARTLIGDLMDAGYTAAPLTEDGALTPGAFAVAPGSLSAGFDLPGGRVALFTHGQVAGRARTYRKNKHAFSSLEELHTGDYVVHAAHGIGVFEGVHSMTVEGVTKDYLRIRYAKGDLLYVPVTQLDLLSRYVGGAGEDAEVKLHRLGGAEWQKTRARVKAAVKDIAKELIALYAKRTSQPGFAFSPDGDLQSDFERRFEYEETEDQLRCAAEIKGDMERPVPMDRLLCGDVGFGKTEVALRAAFKCIADGKQCALLVPTTILAWQHYQTALRRMEGLPVTVEVLSRFRTPRQQEKILRRLRSGEIDLIIGTHKLLGGKVEFRDLGLLIVDEEQRFGVA